MIHHLSIPKQEQCEVEGEAIEATCRTEWNEKIEETRAEYEGQKELVREERDVEVEHIRQSMDAELASITSEMTTQYEAIQQSREQQLERLREKREEECAAAGFEEECTDRFEDQIEAATRAMEEELERMRTERERALQNIETLRTEQVEYQLIISANIVPDICRYNFPLSASAEIKNIYHLYSTNRWKILKFRDRKDWMHCVRSGGSLVQTGAQCAGRIRKSCWRQFTWSMRR